MKLTLQHIGIRSTDALDSWVEEQIFSLQPSLDIEEARVRLARHHQESPAFSVAIHLVTPGPDVFAEGKDHTLQAAFEKTLAQLREKISHRAAKRLQRLKSNLSEPAERSRSYR